MSLTKDIDSNYVYASQWDRVARRFLQTKTGDYSPGNENFNIVWPVLEQVLETNIGGDGYFKYNAFDYGCGTGILAEHLSTLGFKTSACDISSEMIFYAKENTRGYVDYECGGIDVLQKKQKSFALITSIMVLQFVSDIHSLITAFARKLEKNGIIFLAVHNADYIDECIEHGIKFKRLNGNYGSNVVEMLIDNCWIRSYIRSFEWYDKLFMSEGLECIGRLQCSIKSPLGVSKDEKWYSPKYCLAWYKKLGGY